MTREERLELLKQIEKDIHVCSLESTLLDDLKSCAIHSVIEELEQQGSILDKIKADITKFADTIPFNIGEVKAKYRNSGQHDGLEQALEIIEGNEKGDFDIDKWTAESEG